MSNPATFSYQSLMRRAETCGVSDEFIRGYEKLRAKGLSPQQAGEQALRAAVLVGLPGQAATVLMRRLGKA